MLGELGLGHALGDELLDRVSADAGELGDGGLVAGEQLAGLLGLLERVLKLSNGLDLSETTVELDSDNAWNWAVKGAAELGANSYDQAPSSLNTAIKLRKDYAWAWAVKASLLHRIDRLEPALEAVEEALTLRSSPWFAWTTKGWVLDALEGDPRDCEDAFRQGNRTGLASLTARR